MQEMKSCKPFKPYELIATVRILIGDTSEQGAQKSLEVRLSKTKLFQLQELNVLSCRSVDKPETFEETTCTEGGTV